MPHLEDQVINRYLKDICKDAGIDEPVEIEVANGGTSPAMLRKYIKVENLTVVEKITDKYYYFD